MKFTCLQENLSKALSTVSKAVTGKASLPVLSHVLLASDKGRLKLSTTNLETSITTWVGASIDEDGSVCVPARVLYEFVGNLPPVNIFGETQGNALNLVCDKASSKFNGLDASEFPALPEAMAETHLFIDPKNFSDAVMETAFAAATDESRPVLTGVLLYVEKGKLFMVGVDGFRLAERSMLLSEKSIKKDFTAVIPAKTLLEVARLVSSFKEPVEISLNKDGNLLIFKVGDTLISSHLLEGEFPEYKKLIPGSEITSVRVKVQTKDFINALKLANVFAKDAISVVRIKVSSKEGVIYVLSSNNEVGENKSSVAAEITGEDVESAFNSKFILDALNNVKSEEFVFECPLASSAGSPSVMKPSERGDHVYLIMPMQY